MCTSLVEHLQVENADFLKLRSPKVSKVVFAEPLLHVVHVSHLEWIASTVHRSQVYMTSTPPLCWCLST